MGNWIGGKFADLLEGVISTGIDAVLWLLDLIWVMIRDMSAPQMGADFVSLWAGRIFYISLPLLMIFFIAQLLLAAAKQSTADIGKAVIGVITGVIGTIFSVPLVAYLTRGFDSLADGLVGVAMQDVSGGFSSGLFDGLDGAELFAMFAGLSFAGTNPFALAATVAVFAGIFGLTVLIGGIALFLALLVRTNLLYIMVVIGPIMLAGLPWSATRGWAKKWVSIVVALIFSKLGVVVVMAIGTAMLTSSVVGEYSDDDGGGAVLTVMGQFLGAGVMLFVAALTPVATFKFFDFLGENAAATLHAGATGPATAGGQKAMNHLHPGMLRSHSKPSASVATVANAPGGGAAAAAGPAGIAAGAAANGASAALTPATDAVKDAKEIPGGNDGRAPSATSPGVGAPGAGSSSGGTFGAEPGGGGGPPSGESAVMASPPPEDPSSPLPHPGAPGGGSPGSGPAGGDGSSSGEPSVVFSPAPKGGPPSPGSRGPGPISPAQTSS